MKNLIEKTKNMYKKSFTLIELIVVIVVIGILAAIVIPNISSFKEEAKVTSMVADGRNLQTAIDLYQLDYHGDFPTLSGAGDSTNEKPVLGDPHSVNFNALYPAYIRDLPQAKEMYYWIDYQGQFYYSTIDNPNDFTQSDAELTWTANERASKYIVYEVESSSTSASKHSTLKEVGELAGNASSFTPEGYLKENKYFIHIVDEYGNAAPPVHAGYSGTSPFVAEAFDKGVPPTTPEQEELITNPTNKMVVAGGYHTLVVDAQGVLWSFGHNQFGQLGHAENAGTVVPNPMPKQIMTDVKSVSGGGVHTLVLKENGEVWSFGHNQYGQLGHATNNRTLNPNSTPQQIMTGAKSVSAGMYHSTVLKENGELWTFGYNLYGQLGTSINSGTGNPSPVPKQVMTGVTFVESGMYHNLVINENGELLTFGWNRDGQLGHSLNVRTNYANPIPKVILTDAKSASGSYHSLVLKQNGELWSFGSNTYGQLGRPENVGLNGYNATPKQILTNVNEIAAGGHFSLVILADGSLLSFGSNSHGQLGDSRNSGTQTPNEAPTQIATGMKKVYGGMLHSIAVAENGDILSFGSNSHGQLGHTTNSKTENPNTTPTKIVMPLE